MSNNFDEKDVDLLESVLALVPDLIPTALIAKLVREKKISYPIKSVEDFKPHFTKSKVTLKDKTTIKYEQVERFLPKEFFPIETERDLLCRLFISFKRGQLSHLLDKTKPTRMKDFPQGVQPTILPSPSLTIPDLVKLSQVS